MEPNSKPRFNNRGFFMRDRKTDYNARAFHADPSMTDQPSVHPSSVTRLGLDGQTGGWITRRRRVIRHGDGNRPNRAHPFHAHPSMTDQPAVHPSSAARLSPVGQTGGWITRRRRVIRHGDDNRPIRAHPFHANPSMTDQPAVHPSSATRLGFDGQTPGDR